MAKSVITLKDLRESLALMEGIVPEDAKFVNIECDNCSYINCKELKDLPGESKRRLKQLGWRFWTDEELWLDTD